MALFTPKVVADCCNESFHLQSSTFTGLLVVNIFKNIIYCGYNGVMSVCVTLHNNQMLLCCMGGGGGGGGLSCDQIETMGLVIVAWFHDPIGKYNFIIRY